MFDFIKNIFGGNKPGIAVLVDGPNILRKAFNVDLKEIKQEISKYGDIRVAKIYVDQYAGDKLLEAITNQGFESKTTTGDVDVTMAIEAMEYVLDPRIDTIALVTRDTDYLPVLVKARYRGKKTMIVATDVAFSAALKNTADILIILKEKGNVEHRSNGSGDNKEKL
ncbi:TIGR00288 family NYN domain-containing protein [Candidatus Micrarchaeota archaeon]|nr:TIGR00288 family NYN domain-containing protein [Candidatus Micrarchaeota archaeon]